MKHTLFFFFVCIETVHPSQIEHYSLQPFILIAQCVGKAILSHNELKSKLHQANYLACSIESTKSNLSMWLVSKSVQW